MNRNKKLLRKAAQIVLVLIAVSMVVAFVAAVIDLLSRPAHAAELEWRHFGAAPYATSQKDACRKAHAAIDGFNMSPAVKKHFKTALGAACSGGTEAWLTPHQQLEQMWSGGKRPHVMNHITVAELPVRKSPDGRRYRKDTVAETVRALSWSWTFEGRTYTLYLPFACFNWSWSVTVPECATVAYTVNPGDEVRFAVLAQKRLPASACWQLCDGGECSMFPSPCDDCDWVGPLSVLPTGFNPLHTGLYVAHSAEQTLRFPREAEKNYVALCVDREGLGESDAAIVFPQTWGKDTVVTIPADGFPLWGPENVGRVVVPAAK